MHCLQVISVASTSSSALHHNTRAYDVPNVTADQDQGVNVYIMVAIIVLMYVCMSVHT